MPKDQYTDYTVILIPQDKFLAFFVQMLAW